MSRHHIYEALVGRPVEPGVAWWLDLDVGSLRKPCRRLVPVDPLPSTTAGGQVLLAIRAPSPTLRWRMLRLLHKHGPRGRHTRHEVAGLRGAVWWVLGPFAYGGSLYVRLQRAVTGRDPARAERLLGRRHLLVIDPRTADERAWEAPALPASLDEGDDELDLGSEADVAEGAAA